MLVNHFDDTQAKKNITKYLYFVRRRRARNIVYIYSAAGNLSPIRIQIILLICDYFS